MSFHEYIEHGWKLCSIEARTKGPRTRGWNKVENVVPIGRAEHLVGAGLMHAYSGTCAIDIDNLGLSRVWLNDRTPGAEPRARAWGCLVCSSIS